MTGARWSLTARLVFVATLGLYLAGIVIDTTGPRPNVEELGLATSAVMYALVGLLVLRQHPQHRIGWLLLAIGFLGTLGSCSEYVTRAVLVDDRSLPGMVWAAWVGDWYWVPWLWAQFVFLPLLFPSGEPPSPRWRLHLRVASIGAVLSTGGAMFGRTLLLTGPQIGPGDDAVLRIANPVGFLPIENIESDPYILWLSGLFVLALLSVGAVIGRFRRATGLERAQIKVAVFGLVVTVVGFVAGAVLDALGFGTGPIESLLLGVIPLALGVAILRYRLFDVDRLISRTVAYAIATAILLGVYLGSVVVVQAVLRPITGESDLAVAAATLLAAALFRPVLARVRWGVDRRFHRQRYDATRTVETFGHRLRDEVDLGALVTTLRSTVGEVVEPDRITIWLPPRAGGER